MNQITPVIKAPLSPKSNADIRRAQNKVIERLSADPMAARTTITTTGRVGEGLACHVQQGKFETIMDMGPAMGGAAFGPSPGFFARAAVVGCVSIAVKMTAAREGLDVRTVDVKIDVDCDDLAIFALGGGDAGTLESRIAIMVETSEPDDIIADLTNRALAHAPWFLGLKEANTVIVETHTTASLR